MANPVNSVDLTLSSAAFASTYAAELILKINKNANRSIADAATRLVAEWMNWADDAIIAFHDRVGDEGNLSIATMVATGNVDMTGANAVLEMGAPAVGAGGSPRFRMFKGNGGTATFLDVFNDDGATSVRRWLGNIATDESYNLISYDSAGANPVTELNIERGVGVSLASALMMASDTLLTVGRTQGITASAVQTQGQQPLVATLNSVTTVANPNDVVTLPPAAGGTVVVVSNSQSSNTLQVFPASGDLIRPNAVDASVTIPPNGVLIFFGLAGTQWTSGSIS